MGQIDIDPYVSNSQHLHNMPSFMTLSPSIEWCADEEVETI